MKATRAYHEVTARTVGTQTLEWITDLVNRFGDDRVAEAIMDDGRNGAPVGKMLGRVRDRLAREDATKRPPRMPVEVDTWTLLAIVRGEVEAPAGPWIYDASRLGESDYALVLAWSERRLFGERAMPAAVEA